jgi:hypothetical protein
LLLAAKTACHELAVDWIMQRAGDAEHLQALHSNNLLLGWLDSA